MRVEDAALEPLFQPIRINQMQLENRIVMPAMHTMYANADGSVSRRLTAYHQERAYGGVGLQILENSAIEWRRGRANGAPTRIDANEYVAGLHDLTEAVHAAGGKIASQPHHSGRQNPRVNTVDMVGTVAPSPIACRVNLDQPEELSGAAIDALIEIYAESVTRSRSAGFDAVEIHAAHGYLIHQFASPYTNKRRDDWGGSIDNRFRFAREVLAACRAAVGPEFPILVRISGEDGLPGGLVIEEAVELALQLQASGADALHVSAAMHESMQMMMMMHGLPPGALLPLAAAVKKAVHVPVIAVGRLGHDPELAARSIADGLADMVAFGRPLIAEPRLPRLLREGRRDEARPCLACNTCVGELFTQRRMHCVVNPETGQEDSRPDSPPDLTGLKVMVVGGGPAGLEAASRFARSGAQVTLAETETELGGRLRGAAVPQHKRPEYPRLLEFLIRSVERLDIDVQLGRTVDIDTVRNAGFDFVLLANGGEPTTPQPEDGRKYLAADLITNGSPPEGGSALVFGANQVGVDTALWLREYGIAVTIGDPGNEIASDVNILARDHLERLLGEAGVEIRLGTSLDDIDDGVSNLIVSEPTVPRYGRDLPEGVVAIGSAALPNANLRGATISALRALNRFSAVPSKLN